MPSLLNITLVAASALIIYRYLIYPVFVSPLSKIPSAHLTASWSPFWILWARYTETEPETIHSAHLKHGPIVRLGPNEVSVNCLDGGVRTIYTGEFEKPFFYDQFQNYGVPNMFSIKANRPHAARKRMIANVYSKSFMQSSHEVHEMIRCILFDRMLPAIDASGSSLEVYEFNYGVTMEFISSYLFGLSNDTDFIQDIEMRKRFLDMYYKRGGHSFWNEELPGLTQRLRGIGIHLVPKWVHAANDKFEAWMLELCKHAEYSRGTASEDTAKQHKTPPIVYNQLADALQKPTTTGPSKTPPPISSHDEKLLIASELLDHVIAGMDTSGYTLSFLFWELSQQPSLQTSLRLELLTLSPTLERENQSVLPSARSVDTLPLLHAVVMETLRRHAAISGPQPRITPCTPTSLAGSPPLPAGIRVSAQAYSLHRNESVFPNAESWLPGRWLDDAAHKEEMGRWFWAFGSGSRMCVGSNFAMQELKYVTAAIYTNFTTSIVDDTGMDRGDANRAVPTTDDELMLKFSRVR